MASGTASWAIATTVSGTEVFLLPPLTLVIVLHHTDKAERSFYIREACYKPFFFTGTWMKPSCPAWHYHLGCFPFATQLILSVNHYTSLQKPHFHTKVYFKFCVVLATIFFFTILPTPVRISCLPYICTVTRMDIHAREETEHQRLTLSRKVVHLRVTGALKSVFTKEYFLSHVGDCALNYSLLPSLLQILSPKKDALCG